MKQDERKASGVGPPDLAWCYDVLNLSPGASTREIQKAFRKLALVWHPDRFPSSNSRLCKHAEDRFKQLNAAYQALMAEPAAPRASSASEPAPSRRPPPDKAPASPEARGFRFVPVMIGSILLLAICVALAMDGYRYIKIELAQREARSRLETSEEKKKTLLTLAKKRSEDPKELPAPIGTRLSSMRTATRKSEVPAPGAPLEDSSGKMHRPEPSGAGKAAHRNRMTVAALTVRAEALAREGRYKEAKNRYLLALSHIASADNPDASFDDMRQRITDALASDAIRLGAKGYRLYHGRWFSPEDYRAEFIYLPDGRVHYTALRPAAEQFADPLVRAHLRAAFPNRLIHKNQVSCTALRLLENDPSASRFQALYHWEVWTFEGVEEGELNVDLVYHPGENRWEVVWLSKRS
jgi:hypothetical protein